MPEQRPYRPCNGCDVIDDHPRHVVSKVGQPGIQEAWHLDCHASAGCIAGTAPHGELSCAERLEDAEYRHGQHLTDYFAHLRGVASG